MLFRSPVGIVASRISRQLLEATYRFKIPLPALHENQSRDATAGELLRAYCAARGLTVQQGRPDEQRAGRAILKDFINGKLLHCVGPDGYTGEMGVLGDAIKVAMEEKEGWVLQPWRQLGRMAAGQCRTCSCREP